MVFYLSAASAAAGAREMPVVVEMKVSCVTSVSMNPRLSAP